MTDKEQRAQGKEQKAQRVSIDGLIAIQRKLIIAFSIALIICFALAGFAIQYAGYIDGKSNTAWCDLIVGLDERYQSLPEDADPEAQEFASVIHNLRIKLGCK